MVPEEFDRFYDLEKKLNETIDREVDQLEDSFLGELFLEEDLSMPAPIKRGPGRPKGVKESKPRKAKSNVIEEILERTLTSILHLKQLDAFLMEDEVKKYQDALKVQSHGNLVLITAPDEKSLSKPFLRIQENYEGRKYKGSFVSMSRFKKWYKARRKDTQFTYYKDWLGFNFPGRAVTEFIQLYGGKENDAEKALLSKLDLKNVDHQYIIGILEGDHGTLLHEVAHALFSFDEGYKKDVTAFLNKMEYLKDLETVFSKSDYHNSVWLDEMQAYLIAGIGDLDVRGKPMDDIGKFDKIVQDIKKIFQTYIAKYPELAKLV